MRISLKQSKSNAQYLHIILVVPNQICALSTEEITTTVVAIDKVSKTITTPGKI